MTRLNLNNPGDFGRATLSNAGSVLQTLTGTKVGEWDIEEGSFNGVLFHVFQSSVAYQGALSQVQDQGGRRKIKYLFPYIDGQTTDDLGRKPENFSFNILFHGKNYLTGFKALFKELNSEKPGVLIHPVRGRVDCVMEDFQIIHSSEQAQAMAITLTMIEHNFTIGNIETIQSDKSVKGALSRALGAIQAVDQFITQVQGSTRFAALIKRQVTGLLNNFKKDYAATLGRLNSAYNPNGSNDLPGLLPLNKGGTVDSTGEIVTDQYVPLATITDPFSREIVDSLTAEQSATIASQDLQNEVNARREEINTIIETVNNNNGSLEFYDNILDMKATAVLLQQTLERGIASSNAQVVNYVLPRLMTVREVAFENGISPDRSIELELLNRSILSYNYIEKDTVMKVPIS